MNIKKETYKCYISSAIIRRIAQVPFQHGANKGRGASTYVVAKHPAPCYRRGPYTSSPSKRVHLDMVSIDNQKFLAAVDEHSKGSKDGVFYVNDIKQ